MNRLNACKKSRYISMLIGAFSILLGLTYVIGLYGETETEVGHWGLLSVFLGILLIAIRCVKENKITRIILIFIIVLISMIQIPPISLWFAFHGSGISDGTPPSNFIAHWAFSIPHIFIFISCIFNIMQV